MVDIIMVEEKLKSSNRLDKLKKAATDLSEHAFMTVLEFDSSWTWEEKLAFYQKYCKKN